MIPRRLSASLVVLRDASSRSSSSTDFEVLMVQRSARMAFAANTWVFPGGLWDIADGLTHGTGTESDQSGGTSSQTSKVLRTIALRECFEETGVLPLAPGEAGRVGNRNWTMASWSAWREKIRRDAKCWPSFLHEVRGDGADQDLFPSVTPLCAFITPTFEAERSSREYLTYFFIAQLHSSSSSSSSSEPWANCAVDGEESVRSAWLTPQEILARSSDGSISFFPPQFYILQRLCAFESADDAISGAKWFSADDKSEKKGGGREEGKRCLPIVMRPELVGKGNLVLPLDAEHSKYPGPDMARHRVVDWSLREGSAKLEMNDSAASLLHGGDRAWQW